jgi:hypothetical protein
MLDPFVLSEQYTSGESLVAVRILSRATYTLKL